MLSRLDDGQTLGESWQTIIRSIHYLALSSFAISVDWLLDLLEHLVNYFKLALETSMLFLFSRCLILGEESILHADSYTLRF